MRLVECREIDEVFYASDCALGGEVWTIPKPHARQISIQLRVGLGGLHCLDNAHAMGIAHFIEHRLFEKEAGDISDRFAALGGDVNASTGLASTDYTLSCSSHLEEHIDMLCELVFEPYWDAKSIERERDIVASEIRLYRDDPEWVGYYSCLRGAYGEQVIGREIAGDEAFLDAVDADLLDRWHEAFYQPPNTSLFVSGNVDPSHVAGIYENALRRHVRCHPTGIGQAWSETPNVLPPAQGLPLVQTQAAVRHPQIFMAFPDSGLGDPPRTIGRELALEIGLDMAMGPASNAFARWYESGLLLGDSFSAEVHMEQAYGFCMVSAETDSPVQFAEAVCQTLRGDWPGADWRGDFARAQRKIYGQVVRSFETPDGCVEIMNAARQLGGEPFDYINLLGELHPEDIAEGFEHCLNPGRVGIAHLLPGAV